MSGWRGFWRFGVQVSGFGFVGLRPGLLDCACPQPTVGTLMSRFAVQGTAFRLQFQSKGQRRSKKTFMCRILLYSFHKQEDPI